MVKKLFALALAAAVCVLLPGCQEAPAQVSAPEANVSVTEAAAPAAEPTTEPATEPTTVPTEPQNPWIHNRIISMNPWSPNTTDAAMVFGSAYTRDQIHTVTFLDTLSDMPGDAWDVSEAQDGKVMAWMIQEGNQNNLYIAGEGGVLAPADCCGMFYDFQNLTALHGLEHLHTEEVTDMARMFAICYKLESLDLSTFDTSHVVSMNGMFASCTKLHELNLSSFDTSSVTDMNQMFWACKALKSLDVTGFDTSSVTTATDIFLDCPATVNLDIPD